MTDPEPPFDIRINAKAINRRGRQFARSEYAGQGKYMASKGAFVVEDTRPPNQPNVINRKDYRAK